MKEVTHMYLRCVVIAFWILLHNIAIIKYVYKR